MDAHSIIALFRRSVLVSSVVSRWIICLGVKCTWRSWSKSMIEFHFLQLGLKEKTKYLSGEIDESGGWIFWTRRASHVWVKCGVVRSYDPVLFYVISPCSSCISSNTHARGMFVRFALLFMCAFAHEKSRFVSVCVCACAHTFCADNYSREKPSLIFFLLHRSMIQD